MTNRIALRDPWIVAAWPGMGGVGLGAAAYLAQKLGMTEVDEIDSAAHYDVARAEVSNGVVQPPRLPRTRVFEWRRPGEGRDVVLIMGEAQPTVDAYGYSQAVLRRMEDYNASRLVTFASMATQRHPHVGAGLFGVATDEPTLNELRRLEVTPLKDGAIGGLNGVLLAAGAERGVAGACLMGEIPFFATGVPNPGAAKSVLEAFCVMADVTVSFDQITAHAETMNRTIMEMLEQLQAAQARGESGEIDGVVGGEFDLDEPDDFGHDEPDEALPDPAALRRIERLFEAAARDRARAADLKAELDRHDLFGEYEDRFLDLFRAD
ncbi:MAG: PAC2 family protein [Phycisphaerales bacterium]